MKLLDWVVQVFRRGRGLTELAKWLDLPEPELRDWLKGRPPEPRGRDFYYNEFTIPKRRGGARSIAAPSEPLKALQRRIVHRLLNPLPAHPAATGFVPARSIVDNARPHAKQGVVINIDLADFFPSIGAARVRKAFRALGWNKEAATVLANICTHEGHLPQGAPTSPAISNLVCRRLDERLSALTDKLCSTRPRDPQTGKWIEEQSASAEGCGRYTRYADDLTFSFPSFGRNKSLRTRAKNLPAQARPAVVFGRSLLSTIRRIIEEEGFAIQMKKKVRVQRPHQRQTATGLVLNRGVNLPRALRRRIRAMRHHARLGLLDAEGQRRLRGWDAFLTMVARQR